MLASWAALLSLSALPCCLSVVYGGNFFLFLFILFGWIYSFTKTKKYKWKQISPHPLCLICQARGISAYSLLFHV